MCGILNAWVHDKIIHFMHDPELVKKRFNFEMFGCENAVFEKYKYKFASWNTLQCKQWKDFSLKIAKELLNVVGLRDNSIISLAPKEIGRIIESIINERIRETKNVVGDLESNKGNKVILTEVPPYFSCNVDVDSLVNVVTKKFEYTVSSEETNSESSGPIPIFGEKDYTLNACRFDSVMSVLVFLYESCFKQEDIEEFQLNLPTFSIILKLLNINTISNKQFRYIAHSILCPGEKHTYGPITSVYRRFKRLTGASPDDPSIMSLFATPYFNSRPICSRDACDYVFSRKYEGWNYSFSKINHWGSERVNPIEASFICTPGTLQEHCVKCSGPLTHTSFLYSYPNYFSIYCSRDISENLNKEATINFVSMQYRLVSVVYSNYKKEVGQKYSDHFLTIVCKENNGKTSYFLSDGILPVPTINYKCPVELENVNEFPVLYREKFQPHLLIYQKVIINKESDPEFSEAFSISHLDSNKYEHSIQVEFREKIATGYEPDKIALAKYFITSDNLQTLVRGVAFSSNTQLSKEKLSYIYACMQVFFHNNVLAHQILTSKRESNLLQNLRDILLFLRYSNVAVIELNEQWLEKIVTIEDLLINIVKEVHGDFFNADPEKDRRSCDALQDMKTICVEASNLQCIKLDENKLSKVETVSILNSGNKVENFRLTEKIIIGNKEFMLAGFVREGFMNEGKAEEQKKEKELQKNYSAYVKNWDYGVWYRYCFDNVIKITEEEMKEILATGGKDSDSDEEVGDNSAPDNRIVYWSYIHCDLDLKSSFDISEEAFRAVSAEKTNLISDAQRNHGELFLPIRNVLSDFCKEQLYIRSPCPHGSCCIEHQIRGNIMPLKYMELCHPAETSALAINKFFNFCPQIKCNTAEFHDMSELNDTPVKKASRKELSALSALQELEDLKSTPRKKVVKKGKSLRIGNKKAKTSLFNE